MKLNDYATRDATDLAAAVRNGDISPTELVEQAATAIERINPIVNAVTYICIDQALAESRQRGTGPFAGVPILLKDVGAAADGHPAYSGNATLAQLDVRHKHNSRLVERLRTAGFVVVGRSNTPEFALMSDTQNEVFGTTYNPWNLAYAASGSSGGAGAAVASGIVPVAHGTDGAGSIRMPASANGLVGMKPSRGMISEAPDGADALYGLSTDGFLTRSVRDMAALLDIAAGEEPGDPVVAPRPQSFLGALRGPLKRLRIGYVATTPNKRWVTDPAVAAAVQQTASLLKDLGHEVEESHPKMMFDPDFPKMWSYLVNPSVSLLVSDLEQRAAAAGIDARYGEVAAHWAKVGRNTSAPDHTRALLWLNHYRREMAKWWADGFDILLSPVMTMPALPIGYLWSSLESVEDTAEILQFTPQFNNIGAPAISVPANWTEEGLPIGVQLGGRYGEDHIVLQLAAELERARPWIKRYPAPLLGDAPTRHAGPGNGVRMAPIVTGSLPS